MTKAEFNALYNLFEAVATAKKKALGESPERRFSKASAKSAAKSQKTRGLRFTTLDRRAEG